MKIYLEVELTYNFATPCYFIIELFSGINKHTGRSIVLFRLQRTNHVYRFHLLDLTL